MNILIYTTGFSLQEKYIFQKLDDLVTEHGLFKLTLLGNTISNEPFFAWAKTNNIDYDVRELSIKYGPSAAIQAAIDIYLNNNIDALVIQSLDSTTLEIAHMAQCKGIEVALF